jgi:acetyl esterase/lipase
VLSLPRILVAFLFTLTVAPAASTYRLWDGPPPNHRDSDLEEIVDTSQDIIRISKVQDPAIEVYLPTKREATGQAVVICPGGGYGVLAYDWEGVQTAKWLNTIGVAGIVLKYRLPEDASNEVPHLTPLMDAHRALRTVRHRAAEWNIDPDRVGVMGFSAGGHLASTAATQFDTGDPNATDPIDRLSSRPDFAILMYPVVSFVTHSAHSGSRRNLLGEQDSPELRARYSAELNVTAETPPILLIHSADDKSVPVQNSLDLYQALHEQDIPVEMHLYPYGGHGYGLAVGQGYLSTWPDRAADWLESIRRD